MNVNCNKSQHDIFDDIVHGTAKGSIKSIGMRQIQ